MKSAYEIALEKLADQGIDKPREDALSREDRGKVADSQAKARAALAELEILHRDRLKKLIDPSARAEEEKEYRKERERVEDRREREIAAVRGSRDT